MPDIVRVDVLNESSLITDAAITSIVAAMQEDFGQNFHLWSADQAQQLNQIAKGEPASAGARQLVFLDDADQSNALGYHDLTPEGLPMGKVFVRTCQLTDSLVSRVASHEAWEMAVDPWINRVSPVMSNGRVYAIEVGDPLSLDSQARPGLGGVMLSGIALPAAYYTGYGKQYDIGGILYAPLPNVEPPDGAYLMWQVNGSLTGGWAAHIPETADHNAFMAMQPQRGSRRHRRIKGRANWVRSTTKVV